MPEQDGKILGFDDFLKQYKENDPGAFTTEEKPPVFSGHAPGPTGDGTNKDQANAAFRAIFGHD